MNDSRALPPEQEAIQAKCFSNGQVPFFLL